MHDDHDAPNLTDNPHISTDSNATSDATCDANINATVDGLGLSCPEPLMLLRKQVRASKSGDLIALLSDDPVSLRDVPAFCDFMHHTLVSLPDAQHPHRFLIRKG